MAKRILDKDNPNSPDFEDDDYGMTPAQIAEMPVEGLTPAEKRRLGARIDKEVERQAVIIADAFKQVPEKDKQIVLGGATITAEEATGPFIDEDGNLVQPKRKGK